MAQSPAKPASTARAPPGLLSGPAGGQEVPAQGARGGWATGLVQGQPGALTGVGRGRRRAKGWGWGEPVLLLQLGRAPPAHPRRWHCHVATAASLAAPPHLEAPRARAAHLAPSHFSEPRRGPALC